jgi:chemotaxis protein MotA
MKTTILGLIGGFGVILLAIFLKEDVSLFLNWIGIALVLGGTIFSCLIYFSSNAIGFAGQGFVNIFFKKKVSASEAVKILIQISKEAYFSEVIDLLDTDLIKRIPFLEKGMILVADNVEPQQVKRVLVRNSKSLTIKNRVAERVWSVAGSFAPMFGMMGTVIGLIAMLNRIEDPSAIPAAMGLALVTTLYGLILSSVIFVPISGKIRDFNHMNTKVREIVIEGVLSIQSAENTQVTKERLLGFIEDYSE